MNTSKQQEGQLRKFIDWDFDEYINVRPKGGGAEEYSLLEIEGQPSFTKRLSQAPARASLGHFPSTGD
jgi:hypothetical protein